LAASPRGGSSRRLGLDLGTKRIGVALGVGRLALPLAVIAVSPRWVAEVLALAEMHAARELVVGWPVGMSGTPTAATGRIEAMVEDLRKAAAIPVVRVDERLSTQAVERRLAEAGVSSRARRGRLDDLAAAEILQRWLDREDPCAG